MVGLTAFEIHFENPVATYYGGQNVTGFVLVSLTKEKNMRGITLKVVGRAKVKWTERSYGRNRHWKTYKENEEYFLHEIYLIGSSDGDMELHAGDHKFPFSVTLPVDLPSSFEGKDGHIRYTIKATMDRPWKFDPETKAAFTVLSHLDLNTVKDVAVPLRVQEEENMDCCCFKSGSITMTVGIPFRGYVPGQEIPVNIEVDNASDKAVSTVLCEFRKTVNFHGVRVFTSKTRTDKVTISSQNTKSVKPHSSASLTVNFTVPSIPPSFLQNCNIIDIEYELIIRGVIPSGFSDMKMYIPVIIGTIPLVSHFPTPSAPPLTTPSDNPTPSAPPASDISSDLPPSFDDATAAGNKTTNPTSGGGSSNSCEPHTLYPDIRIKLKAVGCAKVKWKERRAGANNRSKTYTGYEQYFQREFYLIGSYDGEMELHAGEHMLPFCVTLPVDLPSSFEGKYGHIRYTIKAKINRSWKHDPETKSAFTVLSHLDLNTQRGIEVPIQLMNETNMDCCCFKSGTIAVMVGIPFRGYVPGQEIPINIEVDNASKDIVSTVRCEFRKTVKFHGYDLFFDKIRSDKNTITCQNTRSVEPHSTASLTVNITVPSIPPSFLQHCKIIDIEYELIIKAVIPSGFSDMKRYIPITIGTIPLVSHFQAQSAPTPITTSDNPTPSAPTPIATSDNPTPSAPTPVSASNNSSDLPPSFDEAIAAGVRRRDPSNPYEPHTLYPDIPPPSYEECMFGKMDIKEEDDNEYTHGDMGFAPRYPMYRFNQTSNINTNLALSSQHSQQNNILSGD